MKNKKRVSFCQAEISQSKDSDQNKSFLLTNVIIYDSMTINKQGVQEKC